MCHSFENTLSKGIIVIVDGNFYYKEQLNDLLTQINPTQIFTLKAPIEVCIKRNAGRKNMYSENAVRFVHGMVSSFDQGTIIETQGKTSEEVTEEILHILSVTYIAK